MFIECIIVIFLLFIPIIIKIFFSNVVATWAILTIYSIFIIFCIIVIKFIPVKNDAYKLHNEKINS